MLQLLSCYYNICCIISLVQTTCYTESDYTGDLLRLTVWEDVQRTLTLGMSNRATISE